MKTRTQMWALFLATIMLGALAAAAPEPPRGYVGLRLKTEDEWLTVAAVAEGSPAQRAGLRGGERILKIDGKNTENKSLMETATWLAGPAGEKVILTLLRPEDTNAQPFEVTLVRVEAKPELRRPQAVLKRQWTRPPTREAGPVEMEGNKIKSRVLPYPDFISFFIRLPLAHAVSTGKGAKIGVVDATDNPPGVTLVQNVAPGAEVTPFLCETNQTDPQALITTATNAGWKVLLVSDPSLYPAAWLTNLIKQLHGTLVV